MYIFIYVCIYLLIYPSIYISIYIYIYLLSIYLSNLISYLSIYLSQFYLSMYPSIHPTLYLREIYYKELAHVIMEANNPNSAIDKLETQESWWYSSSPRPKDWEPGGIMVQILVQVLVWRQEKTKVEAWRQEEKVNSFLFTLFVLSRLSVDWMKPTHTGKRYLFTSVYWFKCSSQPETFS